MLSFSLIRTFIPLCIGVCLGASATVANAYSVSVSAPGSITYSAIQTSASNQTTYIHGTQFSVTDTRGATVGYYATISSSNLTSGSKTIGRENLALYVTGATVSTLSGSANASVVVPTGAGAIGSQYVSLSSATTLISRTNAGGGLYGTYGVSPAFRLTIPAYTPSGSYSATLTITLIENEWACDPNYTWNGSSCVANTQSATCGGSIPSNASANSASTYTQTWNGSAWAPTTSWSHSASAGTCTYDCDSGYSWGGSSCNTIVASAYTGAMFDVLSMHMNSPATTTAISAFADHGNNGKVATVNGNAQISTSQSKFGGASAYFDWTGDYLSYPSTSHFALGTDNFTFESWAYPTDLSTYRWVWHLSAVSGGLEPWYTGLSMQFAPNAWGGFQFYHGWTYHQAAYATNVNTWHHIAVVKNNGTLTVYVNGQNVYSASDSTNYSSLTNLAVGGVYSSAYLFHGYIDDFRITKWVARYTANFTPQSTRFGDNADEDAYYANTVLLLHMDGTNGSTAFMDSGNNGKTVTAYGNAQVSTAQSKFGGASAYFDGNGDYLSTPDSDDFYLGNNDFTLEAWVYKNNTGSVNIVSQDQDGGNTFWVWGMSYSNGMYFQAYSWNTPIISFYQWNLTWWSTGVFQHVTLVRRWNTFTGYIDGVQVVTATDSDSVLNVSAPLIVGSHPSSGGYLNGYLDDLRITKWVARYTANFTPSTAASGDSTASDPYYANTVLSLHMDGTSGSTFFPDSASNGKTITSYWNAITTTSQNKFGGASISIPSGNTSALMIPDSTDFDLGSDNFTIEAWINVPSGGGGYVFAKWFGQGTSSPYYFAATNAWFSFRYSLDGTNGISITGGAGIGYDTWRHISAVRNGWTISLYMDGQLVTSGAISGSIYSGSPRPNVTIGWLPDRNAPTTFGTYSNALYIDDLRVTKWVARYTANFTPPTATFGNSTASDPYYANTVLLLHGDGAQSTTYGTNFRETSNNGKVVTAYGDARVSTSQSKFGGASMSFDGSGDYLQLNDHSDWDFANKDFTVEFWANFSSLTTWQTYTFVSQDGSAEWTGRGWWIQYNDYNDGNLLQFWYSTDGSNVTWLERTWIPSENTWYHLSVVRNQTNLTLYVNGIALGSAYSIGSSTLSNSSKSLLVGAYHATSSSISGSIDDLRITKWVARYTANFTPPTTAFGDTFATDPYFAQTVLLLHADGTNGSTFFPDSANNGKIVTANGDGQISTASPKFGSASYVWWGSNGYLLVPSSTDLTLDWDFTIEWWYKDSSGNGSMFTLGDSAQTSGLEFYHIGNRTTLYTAEGFYYPSTWTFNQYNHVAVVRKNGIITSYINGVGVGSVSISRTFSWILRIGTEYYNGSATTFWNGQIDEFRITKWVARYTANFTPPTAAFGDSSATDPYYAQTVLLLHMDGTNAGTFFPDSANNGKMITAYGDAKMSAGQSKFGGVSASFDGSNWTYLQAPSSTDFQFGTGDFTLEAWVYHSSLSWQQTYLSDIHGNSSGIYFYKTSSNQLWLYYSWLVTSWWTIPANTWTHVAASRKSWVTTLYVNGNAVGSATDSQNLTSTDLYIGNSGWTGITMNGYIDDLRISKWIARYTTNFTPPTAEFADE